MAECTNQAEPVKALPGIHAHWVYKAGVVCDHVSHYIERSRHSRRKAHMQRETDSDERRMDRWEDGRMDGVEFPVLAPQAVVH